MTGQGVIGRDCAWCGLPAVCDVETQAAQYRTVSRRDPVMGRRTSHQAFVRAAIVVPINCGLTPALSPRELCRRRRSV